jgi:arylsulfatase A-like enzyme
MPTRRAFLSALAAAPLAAARRRPNIVYILADDLGWGDLRRYNPDSAIATPNADRLAREGMLFTDMHSPSSVCTPTRYGVLTGRYAWRSRLKSGVLNGWSPNLIEPRRLTVASMLRAQGYYTAGVGKWHLGLGEREKTDYDQPLRTGPLDHGFDYYFGIPASLDMDPYLYFENHRAVERPTARTEGSHLGDPRGAFWRPGPMSPSFKFDQVLPALANKAIDIVRQRAGRRTQPFFLYFPLTGPHTPWMPIAPFRGKSKAGEYGDFVAQVDDVLGRLMKALEESGQARDTLLIFTSDNGAYWGARDKAIYPHLANAGWRGMKADIWEAGHRIPFLARWPGRIPADCVCDEPGCLTDLVATAAAVSGARLPRDAAEDSFNLLPAMEGRRLKNPIREAVVHHSAMGHFSIRQGDWKLCLELGSGGFTQPRTEVPSADGPRGQLYNLREDPGEKVNVYTQFPRIVSRLAALLDKYKSEGRSRPA